MELTARVAQVVLHSICPGTQPQERGFEDACPRFGLRLEHGQAAGARDHPASRGLLAPPGMPDNAVPAHNAACYCH